MFCAIKLCLSVTMTFHRTFLCIFNKELCLKQIFAIQQKKTQYTICKFEFNEFLATLKGLQRQVLFKHVPPFSAQNIRAESLLRVRPKMQNRWYQVCAIGFDMDGSSFECFNKELHRAPSIITVIKHLLQSSGCSR